MPRAVRADDLPAAGVPESDRVGDRAGAESRHECVDLGELDEQRVDQAETGPEQKHNEDRELPGYG